MSNPFGAFNPHVGYVEKVNDDGSFETREVNPEERIVIPCRVCQKGCSRSDFEHGNPWVHVDDDVTVPADLFARISMSKYDHEAQPDIIDCESWEDA